MGASAPWPVCPLPQEQSFYTFIFRFLILGAPFTGGNLLRMSIYESCMGVGDVKRS